MATHNLYLYAFLLIKRVPDVCKHKLIELT